MNVCFSLLKQHNAQLIVDFIWLNECRTRKISWVVNQTWLYQVSVLLLHSMLNFSCSRSWLQHRLIYVAHVRLLHFFLKTNTCCKSLFNVLLFRGLFSIKRPWTITLCLTKTNAATGNAFTFDTSLTNIRNTRFRGIQNIIKQIHSLNEP